MIYKPKRKKGIHLLMIGSFLFPIIIFFLDAEKFNHSPFIILPLFIPFAIVLWLYISTSYKIESNHLIYRSALLHGKIDIYQIKKVTKGKTLWSGTKPALAGKGLIIQYNQYDEIYIAPESNERFLADLTAINPTIIIESYNYEH